MGKSIITFFLAFYLLMGSTILPLGDFSLVNDLPLMYQSYCEIRSGETDVIDFVGDYVMGGKYLLGHNKTDAQPKSDGSLQFQHQASASLFFAATICRLPYKMGTPVGKPLVPMFFFRASQYQSQALRPPIA